MPVSNINATRPSPQELSDLGWSLVEAYFRSGLPKDLDEAIEYGTRALHLTPDGHPDLPVRLTRLSTSYDYRFRRMGKLEDMHRSIECGSLALSLTPDGPPERALRHGNLGIYLNVRYQRLGELQDLVQAIEHKSRALALTPDDHPDLSDRHASLGVAYGDRFERLGELQDMEQAIEHCSRALTLTPDGHPDLSDRHTSLGVAYGDRFQRLGELRDLQLAMNHFFRALALTPDDHPDFAHRHAVLGVSYTDRFKRLGELGDLERAFEHHSRALALTPDGHPDLPHRHAKLGMSYTDLFHRLGNLQDLELAIKHDSHALALTPDGHPNLPDRHASLGMSYTDRFQRLGELEDLEQAIGHHSSALALTPDGHPDLSHRHADLGSSYGDRFQRLGKLGDIEQAIELKSRALELTPDGHPALAGRHASLGISYIDRFRRLGELRDLEQAIEYDSRALALTPDGHPDLSRRHASLGVSYTDRFQRLGELQDLEQAIEHDSRALALTPDDHPDLSDRHAHLGVAYSDRFKSLGKLQDLEQAIEHDSRALALTPGGHPDLSHRHASVGMSYNDRFRHQRQIGDLENAIAHQSRALASTPEGHPDLPRRHFSQAITYLFQHQYTHTQTSLQQSLHHFRNASQGSTGTPHLMFRFASEWARLASNYPPLECIEAYQATMNLLPQYIWLGAATKTRYQDLSKAENLAINAAFAAIRHSNYPLALEWLEHGRCVVWNQSLMLRSPVDQLQSAQPDLASRLQIVSRQLHEVSDESSISQQASSASPPVEEVGRQRRRLAQEHSDLLAQARALPGFEDFLQPMKANRFMHAAKHGRIVVINCHADRCDALILTPGNRDIKHLPLSGFNMEQARCARSELESSLRRKGLRQRGVKPRQPPGYEDCFGRILRELWTHIIQPILDFLGLTNELRIPTHNLPHITWCPTGALSFLPLHAAGDYSQPRSKLFNYAISSYIPTLSALLVSTQSTLNQSSRVLAIGQTNTPGHSPLPGTARELERLKGHTTNKAEYTELMDSQATTAAVLEAMEQHEWVHLACHAHQNVDDPTKSGFYLHDGTLDLASINRKSLKNKGLAFLSACQTATGDEKLPDEAIHLASGMLMAGYPSVIATMWSVVDSDAPFVADKVYAELMKEGKVGNGEAGRALHHAVAALRDKIGEKEFGRWVPYIHIGS